MNENFKIAIIWVYTVHEEVFKLVNLADSCPECLAFRKGPFQPAKRTNHFWGWCDTHLPQNKKLLQVSEDLQFALEHQMGIFCEGLFRKLPDGRRCSVRTPVWRDYLLSLCES